MQACNIHGSIPMGGAMQRNRYLLAIAACAGALVGLPAAAQTPEVTLTRLDCGTDAAPRDVARFSDTFAYKDLKLPFTFSCYLIKHGDEYMVWDTGFVPGSNPDAPKVSLVDQLAQRRRQGRARDAGQGCVRRRHRRDAGHARAYTGPSQLAGQAERERQCAAHRRPCSLP